MNANAFAETTAGDHGVALTNAKQFTLHLLDNSAAYESVPKGIKEIEGLDELLALASAPSQLMQIEDAVTGFDAYAAADTTLERIEFVVEKLAAALDNEIQMEVDRRRGK